MSSEMLSTRIDHETKQAFVSICDQLGMSPSIAIKIFAKAVINHGGIPFEVKVPQPNETTLKAMKELQEGGGHTAESVDSLLTELTEGKVNNV